MKIKNRLAVILLAISSVMFMSTSTASAGDETYAVLDSSGVVVNIIICQPSICGSSGSWGGTMPSDTPWAGQRLVPQFAANSQGQNQGGFIGPVGSGKEVVYSDGTFTINNDVPVNNVEVLTNASNTETSTVAVSVSAGNKTTFSYEDTVGKSLSDVISNTLPLDNNVSATVSATEITSTSTRTESTTFEERKTAEEVSSIFTQRNLTLLQSKISRLLALLDGWIKK